MAYTYSEANGKKKKKKAGKTVELDGGGTRKYNDKGTGYAEYDADGNQTGGGLTGTENWKAPSDGGGSSSGSSRMGALSVDSSNYKANTQALADKQREVLDRYKTQTATIDDITEKYGFDFSREYANRQAEAEAQTRRDALNNQDRQARSNLESTADDLDRDYFQEALQQRQEQVSNGLNAGIAADQDTRMMMSRQAAMGDIYRDTNNERARIADDLGRVDVEELARADALHNERLQQGFQNAMTLTDANRANNQAGFAQQMQLAQSTGNLDGVTLPSELQRQFENELAAQGFNAGERQRIIENEMANRQFDANQQQRQFENRMTEGQLTGNVPLSNEQQDMISRVEALKQNYQDAETAQERQAAHQEANQIRSQLALQGVDPSLVGADVGFEEMQQNLVNNMNPTIDRQQMAQQQDQFDRQLATEQDQFNRRIAMDQDQFDQQMAWDQYQFGNIPASEQARLAQDQLQFNQNLGWQREQFNNLSAAEREQFQLNYARLQQEKEMFDTEQQWREHTFNNMSAAEKERFEENARQFNEEMAWREYEFDRTMRYESGYGFGESSSGGSNQDIRLGREAITDRLMGNDNSGDTAAYSSAPNNVRPIIDRMSDKHDVDPDLISAIMKQESGFQPSVTSHAGAIGLMQLMPGTADGLGVDPWNPEQNADGGTRYIKSQMNNYGDIRLALAAYNAGPGNVNKAISRAGSEDWNAVKRHLPSETQNYVPSVLGHMGRNA